MKFKFLQKEFKKKLSYFLYSLHQAEVAGMKYVSSLFFQTELIFA